MQLLMERYVLVCTIDIFHNSQNKPTAVAYMQIGKKLTFNESLFLIYVCIIIVNGKVNIFTHRSK